MKNGMDGMKMRMGQARLAQILLNELSTAY